MIKAIYAMNKAGFFGGGNGHMGMPWFKCSRDMRKFKELTTNHTVLMGMNTWNSLKQKTLKNRDNWVISRGYNSRLISNLAYIHCLDNAIIYYKEYEQYNNGVDLWIIGGKKTLEQALPHLEEVYISIINDWSVGETRAPIMDYTNFEVVGYEYYPEVEFYTLRRK